MGDVGRRTRAQPPEKEYRVYNGYGRAGRSEYGVWECGVYVLDVEVFGCAV